MSIRKVENRSGNWTQFPEIVSEKLNPFFRPFWAHEGAEKYRVPYGPAVSRPKGVMGDSAHELRPHEAYYWVEGDLPAPPPADDERWATVRSWLWRNLPGDDEPATAEFLSTYRDMSEKYVLPDSPIPNAARKYGDDPLHSNFRDYPASEQETLGFWARGYHDHYWNPTWLRGMPTYRRVGMLPWANGISNDHYSSAVLCLENYLATGDKDSWRMFCLIVLWQAGQGFIHDPKFFERSTGHGFRYEKSAGHWPGSFYPETHPFWSHYWPEGILLFWHLTGELGDVVEMLLANLVANCPHSYNGYWGHRGHGWAFRALRLTNLLFPGLDIDNEYMIRIVDTDLALLAKHDLPFFPNFGGNPPAIEVWQDWLWLSEVAQVAVFGPDGGADTYERIKPIALWHLENTTENGMVAYRALFEGKTLVPGSPQYTSPVHTSFSLPMIGWLVARGDVPASTYRQHLKVCLDYMPKNRYNARGLFHIDESGRQLRPWGAAAEKIGASLMYGLKHDQMKLFGGV